MSIRTRMLLITLTAVIPLMALGRLFRIIDPQSLIAGAKLVFIGRVKSVTPSNIRTTLSYVPYDGVTFQWQIAKVEAVEPFKGVEKGDVVQVAMLSIDKQSRSQPTYSPPGMLEPHKDDVFFFCLGATTHPNVFAALSAPYDENLSILPLYRSETNLDWFVNDSLTKQLLCGDGNLPPDVREREKQRDKEFVLIFSLVGKSGEIQPANVKKFREVFDTDIGKGASTNEVYLEWETYTNPHGWRSDVPKGYEATNRAEQNPSHPSYSSQ